jgi:hypothetical protein
MVKILSWIFVFCVAVIVLCTCTGVCNDTAKTITKEFAPSALLKKYEYFKDVSAAIDKKRADIEMYKESIADVEKRSDGSKDDKFEANQLRAEMRGIITIHNQLCADYNSQMAKFNWRFTNAGDLPAGQTVVLPREVKPYLTTTK